MKKIRFFVEYGTAPFFLDDKCNYFDINDILSNELYLQLLKWDRSFQDTLDDNYPPDSKFSSEEDENKWIEQGKLLYKRIKDELKDKYEIEFHPKLDS